MAQNLRKNNKGFTIIEVLIVLAIAGLILLIVFLAVPALQRNSRNTQYRNSAASLLGGVSEYSTNNNGQLPTGISYAADGKVTYSGGTGTNSSSINIQAGFEAYRITTQAWPSKTGVFNILVDHKCNGNTATTASNRAVAALFQVETGTGTGMVQQCVES